MFVLLGLFLVMGLAACGSIEPKNSTYTFNSNSNVLAFQAMSSVNLLSNNQSQVLETNRIKRMRDEHSTSMEQLEPYLELFEQILTQSNGLEVVIEASDLPQYETKQIFTMKDMFGNNVSYTMYYSNVSLESADDEDDEEDEDDENEMEFLIEGILITGDMTYQISGKREIEDDEEKIEFTAKLSETDYVKVVYKLEDEETKFSYRVYQQGELVNESVIKIEVEDDELKIELSYVSGDNYGEYEFKIENENGEEIIKIQFHTLIDGIHAEGEAKLKVVFDETTQETYYSIIVKESEDEDEHEERFDRDIDEDEDDESDD